MMGDTHSGPTAGPLPAQQGKPEGPQLGRTRDFFHLPVSWGSVGFPPLTLGSSIAHEHALKKHHHHQSQVRARPFQTSI